MSFPHDGRKNGKKPMAAVVASRMRLPRIGRRIIAPSPASGSEFAQMAEESNTQMRQIANPSQAGDPGAMALSIRSRSRAADKEARPYTMVAKSSKGLRAGRSFSALTCHSASAGEISWVCPPMMMRVITRAPSGRANTWRAASGSNPAIG